MCFSVMFSKSASEYKAGLNLMVIEKDKNGRKKPTTDFVFYNHI